MIKMINRLLSKKKFPCVGILENADVNRGANSSTILVAQRRQTKTRLNISVPVWYQIKHGESTRWIMTQSRNYSRTGMRMTLPLDMTPGTEVNIKLKLPKVETPISVEGVVVWVEPFYPANGRLTIECGILFDERQIPHKDKLILFVAERLRRFGLCFTRKLTAQPVQGLADLKTCYELIYKTYLKRGYCAVNPQKMHFSYYCFLPKSRTFILKDEEKLLGTVSLLVDSPCRLPMDSIFSSELNDLRQTGRKLAEVSLLAMVSPERKKKIFSLTNFEKEAKLFRLFKIMFEYARFEGVTDLIIGVHPKHQTLYKFLMFNSVGPVREYPGARNHPALLLHLDLIKAQENSSSVLKTFFLKDATPLDVVCSNLSITSDIVGQFLFAEQPLWPQIPSPAQEYLRQCYPSLS